jgi:hypothetical protein
VLVGCIAEDMEPRVLLVLAAVPCVAVALSAGGLLPLPL